MGILTGRILRTGKGYANHLGMTTQPFPVLESLVGPGARLCTGDMKPNIRYIRFRSRFDFEVGYLVKSPCKECPRQVEFPGCREGCQRIDRIQTILAETISCQRRA